MEGTFELTVWLPASTEEGLALMKRVVVLHEKDFAGFPDESVPKSFASVLRRTSLPRGAYKASTWPNRTCVSVTTTNWLASWSE